MYSVKGITRRGVGENVLGRSEREAIGRTKAFKKSASSISCLEGRVPIQYGRALRMRLWRERKEWSDRLVSWLGCRSPDTCL